MPFDAPSQRPPLSNATWAPLSPLPKLASFRLRFLPTVRACVCWAVCLDSPGPTQFSALRAHRPAGVPRMAAHLKRFTGQSCAFASRCSSHTSAFPRQSRPSGPLQPTTLDAGTSAHSASTRKSPRCQSREPAAVFYSATNGFRHLRLRLPFWDECLFPRTPATHARSGTKTKADPFVPSSNRQRGITPRLRIVDFDRLEDPEHTDTDASLTHRS